MTMTTTVTSEHPTKAAPGTEVTVITVPAVRTVPNARLGDELRDIARQIESATGPIAIQSSNVQLPATALADLIRPRPGPTTLFTADTGPLPVRLTFEQVVEVPTQRHPAGAPNANAIGLLRVADKDQAVTISQLRAAAELATEWNVDHDDPFAWLLMSWIRGGVVIAAEPVAPWPWQLDEPLPDLPAHEARKIQLVRANRSNDGPYSVAVLRRLSKPLSDVGSRWGWSPNAITVASLFIGLAAAYCFALGSRPSLLAGALLLQVSLIVDCADGEVARLTGKYSVLGGWLDAVTDRVKEFVAYAGLAAGGAVAGMDLWWAAALTMTLQTGRHLCDYGFKSFQRGRETAGLAKPLPDTNARAAGFGGILPARAGASANSLLQGVKRAIHLPIGERWLIISVTAALLNPAWTFGVLLTLGTLSLTYATAGRFIRTRTWLGPGFGEQVVRPQVNAAMITQLWSPPATSRGGIVVCVGALAAAVAGAMLLSHNWWAAAVAIAIAGVVLPIGASMLSQWRFG